MTFRDKSQLADPGQLSRTIARLAHEILENNREIGDLVLVGMQTRGVFLARRLRDLIAGLDPVTPGYGELDVTFYRDDWRMKLKQPVVQPTQIDPDITGKTIILVDDVLYTGRTVRAALDALMDLGRPGRIQLAVLVDRGHRELPIRADYVGRNVPTAANEEVRVRMQECDGEDAIWLVEKIDGEA
ncbi:MAG: bifunctional pyr operon transcriptional regulator/uracil phosphoribosyltransferase PyrR [Candidatus Delongbacteria bacterium]|nr:bifunctional pyr operon transcriptional regulator/uracil phosphoribosyltransferase PyrR [Candidatus Delongbacteria bacterium]